MMPRTDIQFGLLLEDAHAKILAVIATDGLISPQLKGKLEYAAQVVKQAQFEVADKLIILRVLENGSRRVKYRESRPSKILCKLEKWDANSGTFKELVAK